MPPKLPDIRNVAYFINAVKRLSGKRNKWVTLFVSILYTIGAIKSIANDQTTEVKPKKASKK